MLPTGTNDPGATWQPHAPPRPGHWSRLVASTGTFESLLPVDATNRDQRPFLYTRPFLLPPLTPPIPPPASSSARNSPSTPAGCPSSAHLRPPRAPLRPPRALRRLTVSHISSSLPLRLRRDRLFRSLRSPRNARRRVATVTVWSRVRHQLAPRAP